VPYLTIAGQTAPGGGIVIGGPNQRGEQIFVSTHDVVIRYLTCDGNNLWDHISTRWMGNKVFPLVSNVSGTMTRTTICS
jgi:hypothetical protein